MKRITFLLFICINIPSSANAEPMQAFTFKENLAKEWMIHRNDHYEPYTNTVDISTIYFWLNVSKFSGDYLEIKSVNKFALFVNGKLMAGYGHRINIDSLTKVLTTSSILIAVHQKNISTKSLQTNIGTWVFSPKSLANTIDKPLTFFRDFVVIASIILLMILIVVLQLNPKLVSDYFSIGRIFSVRETDDNQIYTRITNSTNILFYIFCSLVLGFYLMVVLHFISPIYSLVQYVQSSNFISAMSQWLMLSLVILAIFFIKIILVYGISSLFGSKEIARLHFFNWVRLLLIIFSPLSLILFFYFILYGQSAFFHGILLNLIGWSLCGWVFIIFLKLRRRSNYSAFHLFSYICATEIIPLMIIVTVLYN